MWQWWFRYNVPTVYTVQKMTSYLNKEIQSTGGDIPLIINPHLGDGYNEISQPAKWAKQVDLAF